MQTLVQDLRYAIRQLRLSPVFTLTAMLTLALGIGATTAIFSLVHAVMLRSLPVADPGRLYRVGNSLHCCDSSGMQDDWSLFSYAFYKRLQAQTPEFEQLAAFVANHDSFSVRRGDTGALARFATGEYVSGNYFSMFGVGAFAGRVLAPSDDTPSSAPVALMSYRSWQQNYGADPSVVGSTLIVAGHPFTVVGIAPPGFFGDTLRSDPPEFWMPLNQEPTLEGNSSLLNDTATNWLRIIGRLKPGAATAGLSAKLTTELRQWIPQSGIPAEWMPHVMHELPKQHIDVAPAGDGVGEMKEEYGSSLRILLIICGLVLLIACANIANLLLARGTIRRLRTSVQLALGASRQRLVRQALTESVALALLGGLAGVAVAYGGTKLVLLLTFHSNHYVPIDAAPSLPVLAFAFAASLLTGVLFGTAPAWLATHADPAEALRGANRGTRDRSSLPQKALVVAQVTISVVLLASAGMLAHSLRNLEHRDFGFATSDRVTVEISEPSAAYSQQRLQVLNRQLQERLQRLSGVERAALALYTPFTDNWGAGVMIEGHPPPNLGDNIGSSYDRVSSGFFETIGQPVLRGRGIEEQDTATSRNIAVVNQAFVKKFFKNEDPMGRHFGFDSPDYAGSFEIVGIAKDAKYWQPQAETKPMFFLPMTQIVAYEDPHREAWEARSFFMQGAVLLFHGDIGQLEPQIRKAIAEVDPNITVLSVQTMEQQVAMNFDQQRAVAQLAGLFGIVALLLAAVGLYGVTAYTVARRTSEIGLRIALGADRANVIKLVLRGAILQVAIGLAVGIPIAVGAGRFMGSQLYQVASWDPAALAIAISLLGVCALVAALVPAQRAASVDPVKALRTE